jgi:CHAT domain-containing protein
VVRTLQRWGGELGAYDVDATTSRFVNALSDSDIVHVASHASHAGIELLGGTVGREHVVESALRKVRCRLLLLSACDVGRIDGPTSFVFELVRRGVNVIASPAPIDNTVAAKFFEELFRALLPARRSQGIPLAQAIRKASIACETYFAAVGDQWRAFVDSLVLYGDPSLQLTFTWSGKRSR